jgi:outer membrane lipoprotein SlyB
MINKTVHKKALFAFVIILSLSGCVSGPFKINQSGKSADVVDESATPPTRQVPYQVLIIPSGAVKTSYISDKTSSLGGFLGSMVVGPVAGVVGGLAGSTAGSAAASHAEETASKNIDSQEVAQAIAPVNLPVYFAQKLAVQLKACGINSGIYPDTLEPTKTNWSDSHLTLPSGFRESVAPYRFFIQAGVTGIKLRSGLVDDTLEGDAFVRVYETRSLKQIGRYAYNTGSTGSITLHHYSKASPQQAAELAQASKAVTQYLVSGIATDMCAIMKRF